MDYNLLEKGLVLSEFQNGLRVPLPSVLAGYGPYSSLAEAKTALISTDLFESVENIPRGYTFCVIEGDKPQEYWLTKKGDWSSVEKKNTSSSSSVSITGLILKVKDNYIQVSYDDGDTWYKLVSIDDLKGDPGTTGTPGKDGKNADLSKFRIYMTTQASEDPETGDPVYVYTLKYTIDGITEYTIGTISGLGGGSIESGGYGIIGIKTDVDGNQYWTLDGEWLLDDQGNKVRANGRDGEDGHDGEGYSTQFKSIIFKRSNNYTSETVEGVVIDSLDSSEYPVGGTYSSPVPPSGGWYDGVPSGTAKLWMSTRWFSTNEAINDANNWSTPSPATDTADLDFEYSNASLASVPNGPGANKNINMYNASTNPNGWYDADETVLYDGNALLANANWMAMRVCKDGYWGAWKVFKIRGEAGESPLVPVVTIFSTVFRRSNNYTEVTVSGKTIERLDQSEWPTGGSYGSPNPTNRDGDDVLLWSDGVPRGEGRLWVSTRRFYSDDTASSWKEPVPVGDTEFMDFEWCDQESPAYPTPTRQSPDDNDPQKLVENDGWYDEPDENSDPYWMAMRPVKNGAYDSTDWQVMRVKGERGTDGTSFVPKGQLFGIFDTLVEARSYYSGHTIPSTQKYAIVGTGLTKLYLFNNSSGTDVTSGLSTGDAYVNSGGAGKYSKKAGDLKEHVFIWDGDNFVDFGNIQGPEGVGTYFHIKYSNYPDGNPFTSTAGVPDGETPGDYIGIRVDHDPNDSPNYQDYEWMKFKGEDGFGYEYVFKLTADEEPPVVPTTYPNYVINQGTVDERTVTYQDDDYVPEGWTDDPGSPTKALPFCWVIYRRKQSGAWLEFRGGSADPARAALFSMWTSNGRGVDHIDEMYAVWNYGDSEHVPPLSRFDQSIPEFNLADGYKYLWNYEIIYYDDDTTQTTDPECIAVSEEGRGIADIQEFYYACAYGDPDQSNPDFRRYIPTWGSASNGRSADWKTKPMNVDKNNPFLWNFELITFTDGFQTWTDPVPIAYYVYTDIEYLLTLFEKVEGDSNTAYLGGLLGVVERGTDNQDVLKAMLNTTDLGKSSKYGRLIIASGFTGKDDVDNATFKVYENGRVEMRDAFVQGFLHQYYKTYDNIKDPARDGNYGGDMQIDADKMSNCISVPWHTLGVGLRKTLDLSSPLYPLPVGRVTITNSWYTMDDGTVYYNANNNISIIKVQAFLPEGVLAYMDIVLANGWVQLSKLDFLDADNKPIVTTNSGFNNVYVIHGWGGNVMLNVNYEVRIPTVNANQVITGFSSSEAHSHRRTASASETVIRINSANSSVINIVGGSGEAGTRYVVLPTYNLYTIDNVGLTGSSVDAVAPISYIFHIAGSCSASLIFKVNKIAKQFDDADVANLQDLKVTGPNDVYGVGTSLIITPSATERWFRLTYLPFTGLSATSPEWILESINLVTTV